jgi:hypothetical protein
MNSAQALVFTNDDLFFELIRLAIPDAADVEARHGTDDAVQRLEMRAKTVVAFRLRRLDKRTKRMVDAHCEAFVKHVHSRCMRFQIANVTGNFRDVVRQSVWPTLLFNAGAPLDHLLRTRIPSSIKDVYHLAAGHCAVCGWYCKLQLDSVPVWHQRHASPGEYLPFVSHDHFVEVRFMEATESPSGERRPAMQLRVDQDFTVTDFDFLDFLHEIRQTPEHDACIKRLFAERHERYKIRQSKRSSFIVHLPLFRFKLYSNWGADASIAEIFGKSDDEMRALIMRGSRERRTATFQDHLVF